MVKKSKGRRYSTKTKGRMFVIFMFFGAIILTLSYSLYNSLYQINNINKEKKVLQKKLVALKDDEESLRADIERLSDSSYIARYAREKYLYSKDGEIIIRINE